MEEVRALLLSRVAFYEDCRFLEASLHLPMRALTSTEKPFVADLDLQLHEVVVVCSAACPDATRQARSVLLLPSFRDLCLLTKLLKARSLDSSALFDDLVSVALLLRKKIA